MHNFFTIETVLIVKNLRARLDFIHYNITEIYIKVYLLQHVVR